MTPNTPPLPITPPPANENNFDLLVVLDVVLDAKWLVISLTAASLLLGGLYAELSPPVYRANILLQVEDSQTGAGGALGEASNLFDFKSPASAEMEILRSRLVVGKTVDDLQLYVSAQPKYVPYIGQWLARRATELSEPNFLGMDGYVYGNERIQLGMLELPSAQTLQLVVTEQGYAVQSPNGTTLAEGTVGEVLSWGVGSGVSRILVLDLQGKPGAHFIVASRSRKSALVSLQSQLKISEQGRQSGIIAVSLQGADPDYITKVLASVGSNYVNQNMQRKSAEADKSLDFLNDFLPTLKKQMETSEAAFNQFRNQKGIFDLSAEGQISLNQSVDLQTQLFQMQQKQRELSSQFTASHPSVQLLNAQIAALNKEIAGIGSRVNILPNIEQELLRLTRDVKVNSELYLNLLNSAQQLRLVREGKVGNVRVLDQAMFDENPIAPLRSKILLLSGLMGLMGGIALAFVRNAMNSGIKDSQEIETRTGLNVFAIVPHSEVQSKLYDNIAKKSPGQHLLAITHANDTAIESLRSLRTALQFALLNARNNVVLFTGPTPSIGKSFISANFAAIMGAGGKRVLLLDADLRKGYINQYFGLPRGPGFSELIAGSKTFDDVVQRHVVPGVDIIPTGALPPNPGELLLSHNTEQLIQILSAQYDLVIIDTPPVLAVSDTQVLAPVAGTVFLIAKANVTALDEINESVKRLQQSGVAVKGVLFNDLKAEKRRYGAYGYRYSRYRYTNYKYGQN